MLVFPFIFGHLLLPYLLLFLVFVVAGILFNRFLQRSLRNGPRWGKSPVRPVTPSSRSANVMPPPVSPARSANVTPRPASPARSANVTPRPVSPARSAGVRVAPVSRFAYCRRYSDLLALCAGDVVRADCLVDVESKSSGSAAPDVWVNLAISRFTPSG